MSDQEPAIGAIAWRDLTVADAVGVADFYRRVVGWETTEQSVGDHVDYNVHLPGGGEPGSGDVIAGICHALGSNAAIPPQWLIYVVVGDVAESARLAVELGGEVVDGPRDMGGRPFAVVRDPAGAVIALYQQEA